MTVAEPFLKWAGGKRQLLPELCKRVPKSFGTYWEPFLGGGALFFSLRARPARLSDTNAELGTTWVAIKNDVEGVIDLLESYPYERGFFEKMRSARFSDPAAIAARMIYLNRAGFNGLYRVNSRGQFNVPFGRYKNPTICQADKLRMCHELLRSPDIEIECRDFRTIEPERGDFVYFDPPYLPVSKTGDFVGYTSDGFSLHDHETLVAVARRLKSRGVHVMLSNSIAALPLYVHQACFDVETVDASRRINCKGSKRGSVQEIIVT